MKELYEAIEVKIKASGYPSFCWQYCQQVGSLL